jgi:HPt (histidine-containing phosphotransfer) domain-containing protein
MTPHKPGLPSSSSEVAPDLAPAPPVLDIEAGVERLMGKRAIYLRALARFRNDYRNAASAIRSALDAGDGPRAGRLAHTLKGAAGMIEAPGLHATALALEHALRDGSNGVDALLAQVDATLAAVLRELDAMVLLGEAAPPRTPAPASAVGDILGRLRALLDIGDGAAVELVAAAHSELSVHLGERECEELSAAVADFDYERALDLLDRPRQADR